MFEIVVISLIFLSNFMLIGVIGNYQRREEQREDRLEQLEIYLMEVDRYLGKLQEQGGGKR